MDYILDNIDRKEEAKYLCSLMSNENISQEEKIEIVDKILKRDLDIKECNKYCVLGKAIEYFGDNIEMIKKICSKDITNLSCWSFEYAECLSIEVVNYTLDNMIKEKDLIFCFDHLINNRYISQEKKAEIADVILDRNLVDIKRWNNYNILGKTIEYLEDNTELIEKLKRKGIIKHKKISPYYMRSRFFAPRV